MARPRKAVAVSDVEVVSEDVSVDEVAAAEDAAPEVVDEPAAVEQPVVEVAAPVEVAKVSAAPVVPEWLGGFGLPAQWSI